VTGADRGHRSTATAEPLAIQRADRYTPAGRDVIGGSTFGIWPSRSVLTASFC
jgi:hypothetical protein